MILRTLMPSWIQRLSKLRPGVQIELTEMNVPDLSALRGGAADLLIDHLEDPPADIATMRVGTLHTFVVFPAKHPLAQQKRIALAGTDEQLVREARRLGLVKPGERLFIVRG